MTNAMKTQHSIEELSALLDQELSHKESRLLLDRIDADKALSDRLHRFAVASEVMRTGRPLPLLPDAGFVGRVHAAVAEEPVVLAPRLIRHRLREKAATLALAASIAVLAVLVGHSVNEHAPIMTNDMLAQVELNGSVARSSMEPELHEFLTMHNETAYLSGAQGMLPSIRLVSDTVHR